MKSSVILVSILLIIVVGACQPPTPYCTESSLTYQNPGTEFPPLQETEQTDPISIEVDGKTMEFDQVIHGPLCNNHLSGKVYIACDIQIAEWKEKPTFLDGCDFEVSPGSVLYVAAHNNAPYFQGCDYCHLTGRGLLP